MSEQRLGRDVFIALAAIGWADGKLDQEEADAIVRTALEEGLEIEEIAAIEDATAHPVKLDSIDRASLTKEDRLFIYAVAAWMTRLDGQIDLGEVDALSTLGDLLGVPDAPRLHAAAIAQEIAELPDGDRPERYDLPRLRTTLRERLAEAQRLRAQQSEQ